MEKWQTEFQPLFRDVWDGLRTRPGRTLFGAAAIGLGMMSLTLLLAIMGGLRERATTIEKDFGANALAAVAAESSKSRSGGLQSRHIRVLEKNLNDVSVSILRGHPAGVPGMDGVVQVVSTDHRLLDTRGWQLSGGRWLDPLDLRNAEKHAVLTAALSRQIGKMTGDFVTLGRTVFRVVGVLGDGQGSALASLKSGSLPTSPHAVYVPETVVAAWDIRSPIRPTRFDAIVLRPARGGPIALQRHAERLLSDPALQTPLVSWISPGTLLTDVRNLQRIVRWTAGSVTVLCLALGGMTLASILTANVRERVPEIGLRLTLGGTPEQIAALFLWESILLSVGAATAGTIAALACLLFVGGSLPVPISLDARVFLIPPTGALVLGIAFAYVPARTAAMIRPSETLRNP